MLNYIVVDLWYGREARGRGITISTEHLLDYGLETSKSEWTPPEPINKPMSEAKRQKNRKKRKRKNRG